LKILDVGCGGGNDRLNAYGNVTGVDVSEKSIINAKKIYPNAQVIDVSQGLPFDENSFDLIYCSEVIGHIDKEDKDSVFLRLHHRSGVYGLIAPQHVGSNFITIGLRKYF
jgi:2-polyprenyl-3-methyl-5-hydroxy-6-metoxy-1,4-benzoquinol methylase